MSSPSYQELLQYVVRNEIANALAQKQAELSNLTHSAHVQGHASSFESPGLPRSSFLQDDSVPDYNPSSRASGQLLGTRAHPEHTWMKAAVPSDFRLRDVYETREGPNGKLV